MADVKWCCPGFERKYGQGGERGTAILYGFLGGELQFYLQFRALERGDVLEYVSPKPISLVTQVAINFCPWCGKRLVKHYKKQLEKLPVLVAPI